MRKQEPVDITKDGFCAVCGGYLEAGDKYCRQCGTEKTEGTFQPETNNISCVYGPPISSRYACPSCGHTWVQVALGGPKNFYPKSRGLRLKA